MSDASTDSGFALDSRLAADGIFVTDWPLCRVLLMDDSRFPWLILVPRRPGMVELDDLDAGERTTLAQEIDRAMVLLRTQSTCDKLNVGTLGNIVRQLHLHVVARRMSDAAWPGPVWGSGAAVRYATASRDSLLNALRAGQART
jgi:diadenosine tetraphosphate (Ap4A) HIT family hydrolase